MQQGRWLQQAKKIFQKRLWKTNLIKSLIAHLNFASISFWNQDVWNFCKLFLQKKMAKLADIKSGEEEQMGCWIWWQMFSQRVSIEVSRCFPSFIDPKQCSARWSKRLLKWMLRVATMGVVWVAVIRPD